MLQRSGQGQPDMRRQAVAVDLAGGSRLQPQLRLVDSAPTILQHTVITIKLTELQEKGVARQLFNRSSGKRLRPGGWQMNGPVGMAQAFVDAAACQLYGTGFEQY